MSDKNNTTYDIKPGGLASLAMPAAPRRSLSALFPGGLVRPNTPISNTGCTLRHPIDKTRKSDTKDAHKAVGVPQSAPPLPSHRKKRRSRAKQTDPSIAAWLDQWFFDWLSLTIPNSITGKGSRRGTDAALYAQAVMIKDADARKLALDAYRLEAEAGRREDRDGCDTLCLWAVSQGLHQLRVGIGPNGYSGGLSYGQDPVSTECLALVQSGHKTNMPGLVIPGGDGACAILAPEALRLLGPVLMARADVTWDWSQDGYFDALLEYARTVSRRSKMAAPRLIESDTGRTFYWGNPDGASVKVYQKDLERVAKKRLSEEDADPNLVRVEFRFAPDVDQKAGMAMIARDHGPGALLGSTKWVRSMVEHIAVLTGAADKGATMAVQRVERTPNPRTCADRAGYGLTQYAGAFCAAVVARIVAEQHDGDWLAAELSSDDVRAGVVEMVAAYIDATDAAQKSVMRLGVDRVRNIELEAVRGSRALEDWIERQEIERNIAQSDLLDAAMSVAMRVGDPGRQEQAENCGKLQDTVST